MTEPSNFITITVEGAFRCQSRPTTTGLAADVGLLNDANGLAGLAAAVGLLDDADGDLVADGEPQAAIRSRETNAEANRNVNTTLSPGKLCRSSRSFELADYQLERGHCQTVTVAANCTVIPRA
jgi:hypothetical protein